MQMNTRIRIAGPIVLLTAAALTSAQAPPPAAQRTPTFKVAVDYVQVDAVVTDGQGNPVRDLTKDDFQVYEDGKPQTISSFATVDIPVERTDLPRAVEAPSIESKVMTNARPFDGRVYVMVVDDLHILPTRTPRAIKTAREFIERNLGANDLMAIVHTTGLPDASQQFTNNKRLLLAALDKIRGQGLRSVAVAKTEKYFERQIKPDKKTKFGEDTKEIIDPDKLASLKDPDEAERALNARRSLGTLKNVIDSLGGVRGRKKAILFLSEGLDVEVLRPTRGSTAALSSGQGFGGVQGQIVNSWAPLIAAQTTELIGAAARSNVGIYGIDPRGLTQLDDESVMLPAFPTTDNVLAEIGPESLRDDVRRGQDSLRVLSGETGGFAAVDHNDFASAYARIVKDNSTYYLLAYYPPTGKREGQYHTIDVRVARPGLTVRARKGYASPKSQPATTPASAASGTPAAIRNALNSPIPVSGLTLHVFAAPFRGSGATASVLLGTELRGRDLKLGPDDKVELSYFAIDAQGKTHGANANTVTLALKPETRARVEQTGVRLLNRLDLPPGRYQLHVAANDGEDGKVGSVVYDLEVPDFTKGPLLMSGLVLSSMAGSQMPTARGDEQLKPVLPGPPVALREFPQNDELALFAEVYDNQADSPHDVDIVATVTSDEGKVVFKNEGTRAPSEIQGKRGGYDYATRIPMNDLPPGAYVLKVEARSRLGQGPTASRELQFSVGGAKPPAAR
jgi:VWFA-related protein